MEANARISAARFSAQGAMLFTGYGLAQAMSFVRNAILGHALSPRDFGIAASITLLLQLVETLSDLGSDRLIVQAEDGEDPSFIATTHSVLAARGVLLALIMMGCGPLAAKFFGTPEATEMFLWASAVPLIKGFTDLDCRRAQRRFDNRPQLLVEVVPQAIALFATLPIVRMTENFAAVVVIAIIQAAAGVIVSRLVSASPYTFAADRNVAKRLIGFGWPILISALPLIAVYQGDRAIIGRLFGVEALALYSAAFMITMVPGLLAARAGHALMLPLFSETLRLQGSLKSRYTLMCEATTLLAALYLCAFLIAGGRMLALAFGPSYAGHGAIVSWLALMWAMRMLQAVPGMALMAAGETKPFLIAGLIRASVLPMVLSAALRGAPMPLLAALGCAGELFSLLYVSIRLQGIERGLGLVLLSRALFLGVAAVLGMTVSAIHFPGLVQLIVVATGVLSILCAAGATVMPSLRALVRQLLSQTLGLAVR